MNDVIELTAGGLRWRLSAEHRELLLDGDGLRLDEWLKNVRQHGYLTLVGGSRLKGTAREEAAARARRFFSLLM